MRLKLYCCLKTGFLEIHIYTHKFPLLNSYLSRKCEEQRLRKSQSVTNYSQNKVSTYNTFESFGTTHYCLFCGKLGSARCLVEHVQSLKVPKWWKEKSISFIRGGGRLDHFLYIWNLKKIFDLFLCISVCSSFIFVSLFVVFKFRWNFRCLLYFIKICLSVFPCIFSFSSHTKKNLSFFLCVYLLIFF